MPINAFGMWVPPTAVKVAPPEYTDRSPEWIAEAKDSVVQELTGLIEGHGIAAEEAKTLAIGLQDRIEYHCSAVGESLTIRDGFGNRRSANDPRFPSVLRGIALRAVEQAQRQKADASQPEPEQPTSDQIRERTRQAFRSDPSYSL